ncbi:MAG: 30S ribosomal protein S14 [Candidatus Verstraetearchaeota archaeon]|nr:30S ribosomal protein S14 [Candidatus Verstraetearchaeota archaeon]
MSKETTKDISKKEFRVCRRCGSKGGALVRKYGLQVCRQCFREIASSLGFKKYM